MSRMSDIWQDQQDRDNESGIDLCECWHENNRQIFNEFEEIQNQIKESRNDQARNIESFKTPF